MTSKAALFALLAVWGVGLGGTLPARADDAMPEGPVTETKTDCGTTAPGLVNRLWQKTDDAGVPSEVRIFLADGTLVVDDSWETHHLSAWKLTGVDELSWNEDGKAVSARIAQLSDDQLTLVFDRRGKPVEVHYTAAPLGPVCADLPKA
ncbi:MAG TPA: hypothetical protein VHB74_04525 [Devosia sp.]|nr:hypothetical protein [Devosia sp.]